MLIGTSHSVRQSGLSDRPARTLDQIYTSDKNTSQTEEFSSLLKYLFKRETKTRTLTDFVHLPLSGNFLDPLKDLFDHKDDSNQTVAKFSLRKPSHPDDDLCYIVPGKPDSLAACTFNSTSKTFLVIHGWTVSGDASACCDLPLSLKHPRALLTKLYFGFEKEKNTCDWLCVIISPNSRAIKSGQIHITNFHDKQQHVHGVNAKEHAVKLDWWWL